MASQSRYRRNNHAIRAGLTLLEVLLALAISAIILGMVAGTIRLQFNMLDSRRSGIDQAELARAVLRQIRLDFESCTVPGVTPVTGGGTTTTTNPDPLEAGMFGDLYSIRFTTNRSDRNLMQSVLDPTDLDPTMPVSGFQSVSYYLGIPQNQLTATGTSTGNVGAGAAAGASSGQSAMGAGVGLSLIRTILDKTVQVSMTQLGDPTMTELFAKEMAPEVNYLTFRYFDGLQWHEQWDSQTPPNGATEPQLPVAVEITMGFDDGEDLTGSSTGVSPGGTGGAQGGGTTITSLALNGASENIYQIVVKLPTSLLPLPP